MDQHEYEGLVRRLEAEAFNRPAFFRSKVFLLTCVAYIALLAIFAAGGALLYLAANWAHTDRRGYWLAFGLAISLVPALYVTLRTFFIRLQPPEGVELTRKSAPALFRVLENMRYKMIGPPFHRVVVNREFNAAISQVPRWGLFGGYRNYLVLGLPYLYAVTTHEMLATIAHEYGHVVGNHGMLSAWVYRQRITFGALLERVESSAQDNIVNALIAWAVRAFAPYFNAHTFVLARQDEYEADRTATELVGTGPNASGLIRAELLARWIHEEFWPKLYRQADTRPEPVFMPYASMEKAFAASFDQWATGDKLMAAWRKGSDLHDTHPSLSDRVVMMGGKPSLPPPVESSAAEKLLGPLAAKLAHEFDRHWWEQEEQPWQKQHQHAVRSRARLAELAHAPLQTLALAVLQEYALLTAEFDAPAAAKPILQHLLAQPGGPFPKPAYYLGRILLEERDRSGLGYLEQAAKADRSLVEECGRIGYAFLLDQQDEQAANGWWEQLMAEVEQDRANSR